MWGGSEEQGTKSKMAKEQGNENPTVPTQGLNQHCPVYLQCDKYNKHLVGYHQSPKHLVNYHH